MKDSVRVYFKEISRYQLLTPQQEIEYAQQVQQMMYLIKAMQAVRERLDREPTLTEWATYVQITENELNQILKRGQRAKQKMVTSNLRLVVAIAKKYQHRGLDLVDLIQEGSIGLQTGVEKFAPNKGYRLSTYCKWWIRKAIVDAIAKTGGTIRLPNSVIEKLNQIKKSRQQLAQQLGRTPTLNEIGERLNLTAQQVKNYLEKARKPVSLDLATGDRQDTRLVELLEFDGILPEDYVMLCELSSHVETLLIQLKPRQREVLAMRFGLKDGQQLSQAKVAARLGLSAERVRRIEKMSLEQLR